MKDNGHWEDSDWYEEDDNYDDGVQFDYNQELPMRSFTIRTIKNYTFNVEDGIMVYPVIYPDGMVINIVHGFDNTKNYTGDYTNPPIPKGFKRITGYSEDDWINGIVIESTESKENRNQYVWVPVGCIEADGTLDCIHECEPFGRRAFENERLSPYNLKEYVSTNTYRLANGNYSNEQLCFALIEVVLVVLTELCEMTTEDDEIYQNLEARTFDILDEIEKMARGEIPADNATIGKLYKLLEELEDFSGEDSFNEAYDSELETIHHQVEQYGGFYVSRYLISKGEDALPHSIAGKKPWTDIDFYQAQRVVSLLEPNSKSVVPCILSGAAYDSMVESVFERNLDREGEFFDDSSSLGNYRTSKHGEQTILPTGSRDSWYVSGIADISGNVRVMTQEMNRSSYCVVRGGSYLDSGEDSPLTHRGFIPLDFESPLVGFRAMLFINPEEEKTYNQ